MPRIVDHDERRRDLARAVWSLMREEGLEAVTIRAVAERSGWSSGAVRHYLPNREAILAFAAERVRSEFAEHLKARRVTGDPLADLRSLMLAVLPLHEGTKSMMEIWLAFLGAAVTGRASAGHAIVYDDLNGLLIDALQALATAGCVPDADVRGLAVELHALLDGMAGQRLLDHITDEDAERVIDSWLRRVTARR